jgi:predicted transcriptional regulator
MKNALKIASTEPQLANSIPSNSSKKYRNSFDIIASILETARKGATLFTITRYVNTNYRHLRKYLNFLIKREFIDIKIDNGRILYKTCERGFEFLRVYHILLDMLSVVNTTPPIAKMICQHVNRSPRKI